MRKYIFKSGIIVHCAAIDRTNSSRKKITRALTFYYFLKHENLPKEENIYVCQFYFDSSCLKRDFRVSSISHPLYFIHFCVGIEYRFCVNIHFFSSLWNELPGISKRRLLTKNAVPKIFSYMKATQKRKTTERRQTCLTKHQLIDDAV